MPVLALLSGLGGLLLLALVFQGPRRALSQFFDIPGNVRLLADAIQRFRRAGRVLVVLLLSAVASWTVWQTRFYARPQNLEELALLLKNKGLWGVAMEQGILAALTPFRDLSGLADTMVLLLVASVLVFKASAERWAVDSLDQVDEEIPAWGTLAWGSAWLFVIYRVIWLVLSPDGEPAYLRIYLEPFLIPLLMVIADGLLLGWVLVEFRRATLDGASEVSGQGIGEAVSWLAPAIMVCIITLPARIICVTAYLSTRYIPVTAPGWLRDALIWLLLGWGPTILQAASLVLLPLVGAAAYGPIHGGIWLVFWKMLRAEGGRLAALVAFGVGCCGLAAALSYLILFQFPAQTWLLAAADSYSHYLTLPFGLLLLASLVEIAARVSPEPSPEAVPNDQKNPVDVQEVTDIVVFPDRS